MREGVAERDPQSRGTLGLGREGGRERQEQARGEGRTVEGFGSRRGCAGGDRRKDTQGSRMGGQGVGQRPRSRRASRGTPREATRPTQGPCSAWSQTAGGTWIPLAGGRAGRLLGEGSGRAAGTPGSEAPALCAAGQLPGRQNEQGRGGASRAALIVTAKAPAAACGPGSSRETGQRGYTCIHVGTSL